MRRFIPIVVVLVLTCGRANADSLTRRLEKLKPDLTRQFSVPIDEWRFNETDVPGGALPNLDDHNWSAVSPGYSWSGKNTKVWFRTKITIPAQVAGVSVEGMPVRLDLGVDDNGELYVDGRLREAFHWDDCHYTLTEHARPGRTYAVALRGLNGPGEGKLLAARLYFDVLPELDRYVDEATFVGLLAPHVSPERRKLLDQELKASEACINFDRVTPANVQLIRDQFTRAEAKLAPVAEFTRKYDVYYVGHAHIDMNWLWDWPKTIDICKRTWNSAVNLMAEFPGFCFVQSQPAAYVPIEKLYPAEFARIRSAIAGGQWDPVGGLWDESDTDLPSGEGLARSFLLGQRYFKSQFGKYAVTGWLPDSFGHTWQLPQIMQLAGLRYFYHMRCGNGMEFNWWESPDGSRVLKANTKPYSAKVEIGQLIKPFENEAALHVPQSLVVFGVGDHGGGPTREEILRIESFQHDPILPRVHFATADDFFAQLAKQPGTANLPVVDTGLQYVFTGCYTTHADIKKALRSSENNLYSAEVLSSLAAMMGRPYPVRAFRNAWKPVAFAQFHDIACGSAIHSTYDWMDRQLAPSFRFEKKQTDNCLDTLASHADTRGPADEAIVVWNTLSFPRNDIVKVPLTRARRFHSVVDNRGRSWPAQATDGSRLAFVARAVPAFGHAVYFPSTNVCASDGITLETSGDAYAVQTPRLTLRINKRTGIFSRLYLKPAKWSVFDGARDADALEVLGDSGNAWNIHYTGQDTELTNTATKVSVLDDGPVFTRVRVTRVSGHSGFSRDISVYGALPRIDVATAVDWRERHKLLKIRLPVNALHPEAQAEIPFASSVRPTTGQECPGQKWMDVSDVIPGDAAAGAQGGLPARYGLSVLNDCKYGFDVRGNVFRLTALRSSSKPDPRPDEGWQVFTYSLYPHTGDWRAARTGEQALALNIPLLAKVTTPHPPAGRIPSFTLVNAGGHGGLVATALKHSEDGKGYILRFYESQGQDTRARIDFDRPFKVEETDLLERPIKKHPLKVEHNSVSLPVGHNQIVTLHIWS